MSKIEIDEVEMRKMEPKFLDTIHVIGPEPERFATLGSPKHALVYNYTPFILIHNQTISITKTLVLSTNVTLKTTPSNNPPTRRFPRIVPSRSICTRKHNLENPHILLPISRTNFVLHSLDLDYTTTRKDVVKLCLSVFVRCEEAYGKSKL